MHPIAGSLDEGVDEEEKRQGFYRDVWIHVLRLAHLFKTR